MYDRIAEVGHRKNTNKVLSDAKAEHDLLPPLSHTKKLLHSVNANSFHVRVEKKVLVEQVIKQAKDICYLRAEVAGLHKTIAERITPHNKRATKRLINTADAGHAMYWNLVASHHLSDRALPSRDEEGRPDSLPTTSPENGTVTASLRKRVLSALIR